jgi:hypothetical protein
VIERYGAPGGIRTPDLLVRSQTLYPAELRAHSLKILAQLCGVALPTALRNNFVDGGAAEFCSSRFGT